ncbi:hypothetical protein GCM10010381_14350 [Streptomyces xantholiticus]|nr:hypothetical protein GCM10010381_14350 [Streptomyces xantholiticus]
MGVRATGGMAARFIEDLMRMPDAEVVAVASRTGASPKAFAGAEPEEFRRPQGLAGARGERGERGERGDAGRAGGRVRVAPRPARRHAAVMRTLDAVRDRIGVRFPGETVANRTVPYQTVANRTVANRTVANRTVANRTVANRTCSN